VIPVTTFHGRAVALVGLGGSGLATAQALVAGGAEVACWDDGEKGRDAARGAGLTVEDLKEADWSRFAALILSPGVPLTHPAPHWSVLKARAAGIEIIGDIELFCRERRAHAPDAPFIAITGTNGKSTTTALIAHLLRAAGRDVEMGGNIGTAILSLEPPARARVHVIECSSFQIDLAPSLNPHIGVLLNLTPDHLDRHGTMAHYAAIKERLIAGSDIAVVGYDDDRCRAIADRFAATGRSLALISTDQAVEPGLYRDGTMLVWGCDGFSKPAVDLAGMAALRGAHNAQNAAAAYAAVAALGIDEAVIARGMRSFPGLAHRMESLGHVGRALFVNDSKATNADATEKALATFPAGLHWIIGGQPKEGGIEPLSGYFPRIERAYLIGQSSDQFAATLDGKVAYERCDTLDMAVVRAASEAAGSQASEPVVLLSPACASYDQFANFEARGARFRALVEALSGFVPLTKE
jgi:UDP-N-acetylmuramoylalanine--D-glutamate ligase